MSDKKVMAMKTIYCKEWCNEMKLVLLVTVFVERSY